MSYIDRDPREIRQLPEPNYKALTLNSRPGDPAEKLTAQARDALNKLKMLERLLGGEARAANEECHDQRDENYAREKRIADLKRGSPSRESLSIAAAEEEKLALGKKRLAALEEQRRQCQEKVAPLRLLLRNIDENLARSTGPFTSAPPVTQKLLSGETPMAAVLRYRKIADEARLALQDALDAPIPSDQAKLINRERIETLASAGRPNVLTTLEGRKPARFAMRVARPGELHDEIDVQATLAWLFKDELVAAIERAIDEDADDASALTDKDRAARIAQAKADILAAERLEEMAIRLAAEGGAFISRRPDADYRAVLGLADSCPEPRA